METIQEITKILGKPNEKTTKNNNILVDKKDYQNSYLAFAKDFIKKKKYVIDDENRIFLTEFLDYFFNKSISKIDTNKGLLLIGNVGSGKSLAFKIVKKMRGGTLWPLRLFYTSELVRLYSRDGADSLEILKQRKDIVDISEIIIDDIGVEDNAMHYGNRVNTIAEVINMRYNMYQDYGAITHFTTNLTLDEIEGKYGQRIASRLNEMCNIVKLGVSKESKDRRYE